jgi:2-polyprenyl-3-methyl-5-hydroxy-6-metoxy-1,4-benzoquinol methylase
MNLVSAHYADAAARLKDRYASVRFEEVHGPRLPYLPVPGAWVADIGAGSGRDAEALADRGYRVAAVEPSAAMRLHAGLMDARKGVRWFDDRLPNLADLREAGTLFEFILCSAVLMHLAADDLELAFQSLADLTAPGGHLAVSLRSPRADDHPGVYSDHSPPSILAAAEGAGLRLVEQGSPLDALSRADTTWRWYVFARGQRFREADLPDVA